jgi:hypothetical protein
VGFVGLVRLRRRVNGIARKIRRRQVGLAVSVSVLLRSMVSSKYAGIHKIRAKYSGDDTFNPNKAQAINQKVRR